MARKKSNTAKNWIIASVLLLSLIFFFIPGMTYAPAAVQLNGNFQLKNECYGITQIIPIAEGEYRIGISSRKSCFELKELQDKMPIIVSTLANPFDQTYVDFYSFKQGEEARFLYSEVSGNLTRTGALLGLVLLMGLGILVFSIYKRSLGLSKKQRKEATLLKVLAFMILLVMMECVLWAFHMNVLSITNVPRYEMGIEVSD